MGNPHSRRKTKEPLWLMAVLAALLLATAALLLLWPEDIIFSPAADSSGTEAEEVSGGSIAIPGFESFTLLADSRQQTVALANPAENHCYFVITLSLEDGTELWQSERIAPGDTSEAMVLNTPLSEGTYPNAVLRYQCFRMDKHLTPLNGAETRLTLFVRK